jgi:hypothetical protein
MGHRRAFGREARRQVEIQLVNAFHRSWSKPCSCIDPMRSTPDAVPRYVTILAGSRETAAGLQRYFDDSGIVSHATFRPNDVPDVPEASRAVVIFPDGLDAKEVANWISRVRSRRRRLLVVVVTSSPHSLTPSLDLDGRSLAPVVLSTPAFGWAILDAIRAAAAPD